MIMLVLCIIGAISGSFLPETLHQKLPDSLTEARMFGADQVCLMFLSFDRDREFRVNILISSKIYPQFVLSFWQCRNFGVYRKHRKKMRESIISLPMNWRDLIQCCESWHAQLPPRK